MLRIAGMIASLAVIALFLNGALSSAIAQEQPERTAIVFDIPAQSMADALQAFAKQADLQILFKPESLGVLRTPGLSGRMTVEQALDALLKGSGLEHVRNGDVVVVRNPAAGTGTSTASESPPIETRGLAIAQASETHAAGPVAPAAKDLGEGEEDSASNAHAIYLGETLVTGTLIRGAPPSSPLIVMNRDMIEATGYSTLQQVMQTLPQNFGGGAAEATVFSPGNDGANIAKGTGINLRGLGSDATLVLLNGQRLAPSSLGQFVDVSMIPLSAVRRIDVLTDGASATYGSDAVAGVVNFILDDRFSGADVLLKAGSVTEGHLDEYQAALTLGTTGDRFNGLLSYEYYQRGNLDSAERDYSEPALDPFDLLAEQERHSVLASGAVHLTERLSVNATGLYSERDAFYRAANTVLLVPTLQPSRSAFTSANIGASFELPEDWASTLTFLFGRNDVSSTVHFPTFDLNFFQRNRMEIQSGELRADGPLLALPAGESRLALGASLREESFAASFLGTSAPEGEREARAAFAEVSVPVLDTLTLSLAGRYEDYSDFGDTFDPKYGLSFTPLEGLKLRATYGTSFRAPLLLELNPYNSTPFLTNYVDPAAPDGQTLTMLMQGNNPDLQPETSTTWTLGLDFTSRLTPGTRLSLTYFDIEFEDKIAEPLPGVQVRSLYSTPGLEAQYASLLTRNPDDAVIAALAAQPGFQNGYGPFAPGDVEALFDRRLQNFSSTRTRGLDLAFSQGLTRGAHAFTFSLDGTYLFDYSEAVAPTAPSADLLDTVYHPLDLRLRGGVHWHVTNWRTALFINYTGAYTNPTVMPAQSVDAWTTADLSVQYNARRLADTRFSLSVLNLTDEDPPFVSSPLAPFAFGFDATNASALGRFVALSLSKQW